MKFIILSAFIFALFAYAFCQATDTPRASQCTKPVEPAGACKLTDKTKNNVYFNSASGKCELYKDGKECLKGENKFNTISLCRQKCGLAPKPKPKPATPPKP